MKFFIIIALCIIGATQARVAKVKRQSQSDFGSQSITGDIGTNDQAIARTSECDGPGTVCVPYYQCNNGQIITDGSGLIDIRLGGPCQRFLDVCCREEFYDTTPIPPIPPYKSTCGRRNHHGVDVKVSGTSFNVTQTQFGEYPWMAAVLRVENIGQEEVNLYLCGGSIIQPNIVLTAAHCVAGYGDLSNLVIKVRAGEWDTQSTYEIYGHQDRIVNQILLHPGFNGGSLHNDFALFILEEPFALSPNVDTVCLPSINEPYDPVQCVATGWGKDKFGNEGSFQNILKQVELEVINNEDCEYDLQGTRLGNHFQLDDSFLCAGGRTGIDTCKGDGGSPLVCPKHNFDGTRTYLQVGIVAWGIGCGEEGIPGVYANITHGLDWMYEVIPKYLINSQIVN